MNVSNSAFMGLSTFNAQFGHETTILPMRDRPVTQAYTDAVLKPIKPLEGKIFTQLCD